MPELPIICDLHCPICEDVGQAIYQPYRELPEGHPLYGKNIVSQDAVYGCSNCGYRVEEHNILERKFAVESIPQLETACFADALKGE